MTMTWPDVRCLGCRDLLHQPTDAYPDDHRWFDTSGEATCPANPPGFAHQPTLKHLPPASAQGPDAPWLAEFGSEYAVPALILEAGLPDVSWHNDACPAFGSSEHDSDIVLWVEHPDPAERELTSASLAGVVAAGDFRYAVTTANGETVIWTGDDPEAALSAYRMAAARPATGGDLPAATPN